MKYRAPSLVVGALFAALTCIPPPVLAEETASAEIDKRAKDPNQWPAPGRDNQLTRHSPLKDINTGNVTQAGDDLVAVDRRAARPEGQPVVDERRRRQADDVLRQRLPEHGACNIVQALDLTDPDNPKQIWNYVKKTDRDESAVPRACCDTVNRGLNYANGKVIIHTLDGFVIALDALTGKEVWVVKHAYPENGETDHRPDLDRREPGDRRLRRRRVRRARPHHGLRPRDRQGGVDTATRPAPTRMSA